MKHLVIGDIHGCHSELMELIEAAGISAGDRIIALGDLIDRGPASRDVVEFFMSAPNASSVLGNHESRHVRMSKSRQAPALEQHLTARQFDDAGYARVIEYFESLPLYIELPEAILVHDGLGRGLPLRFREDGDDEAASLIYGENYPGTAFPRSWYELYDGDKPVIAGHINPGGGRAPFIYKNRVYLIDTGCCYGRALTGVLLPDFKVISVMSRRNYRSESLARANVRFDGHDSEFE